MIHFSLLADPVSAIVNQEFLISAANWKCKSIQDICVRISKVDYICQIIIGHFRLKARPYQVSILLDIRYKKREIYAITSTNTGNNLIY